jgi:hypothetical protein
MATALFIRPLQGRAWWACSLPGALPPATLGIPFGDYHRIDCLRCPAKDVGHAQPLWGCIPHSKLKRHDLPGRQVAGTRNLEPAFANLPANGLHLGHEVCILKLGRANRKKYHLEILRRLGEPPWRTLLIGAQGKRSVGSGFEAGEARARSVQLAHSRLYAPDFYLWNSRTPKTGQKPKREFWVTQPGKL